jgi:hypothetical protein
MFGHVDEATTKRLQRIDNALQDDEIEAKIKECQRENGECMKSTSRRLKEQYGNQKVDTILRRLSTRRYRGNKYQEKGTNEIMNLLKQLTSKKVNQEQFSL